MVLQTSSHCAKSLVLRIVIQSRYYSRKELLITVLLRQKQCYSTAVFFTQIGKTVEFHLSNRIEQPVSTTVSCRLVRATPRGREDLV